LTERPVLGAAPPQEAEAPSAETGESSGVEEIEHDSTTGSCTCQELLNGAVVSSFEIPIGGHCGPLCLSMRVGYSFRIE
jgi:hypothetical protein